MGCDINVGRAEGLMCPIGALGDFLALRGSSEGPLLILHLVMVALLHGNCCLS